MRPHGRAKISSKYPQALSICQRCGFMYNRVDLKWQFDWEMGPRLFNQGILVCESCLDVPQPSGRPIVLPPDPVAIDTPVPENYADANNPESTVGYNLLNAFLPTPAQTYGGNIGTMTLNAGVNAAFDGTTNKRARYSAALSISNSSFGNTVGKNWNADTSGITATTPSTVASVTHVVSSVTLYAPNDQKFLNSATGITGYRLDGSLNNATWTTILSGTTAGTVGETITASTTSGAAYPYHRIAIQGDGISAVAIAQAQFNISDAFPNDI